jgi:glutathione synthase/RimK-type ligase-like ATP-grasp enzyme
VRWSETPVTVVRSTWDYHRSPRRWLEWIDHVAVATTLINPVAMLRWNTDKRYLHDLAGAGVPCVPTVFVAPDDDLTLRSIMRERGWPDVVVKPAVGASASGARRFTDGTSVAAGETHLAKLAARGAVLVQPYLPTVETARERSLVFIDGAFAHAFTKPAFNTNAAGGTALLPHAPSPAELALATAALRASPGSALYARVDMVPVDDGPSLMELELIEPDLGLRLDRTVADRLAGACLQHSPTCSRIRVRTEQF